jgi:beta-mannosidase
LAKVLSIGGEIRQALTGWQMGRSAAFAVHDPSHLPANFDWLPAIVPGTVAASLAAAGSWQFETFAPLEQDDYWYRTSLEGNGPARLVFEGLATLAEVYLDDDLILNSDNMFLSHEVEVELAGSHQLLICFRALQPALEAKRKRARWRPRLPSAQNLRFIRTTLLGHAPGWSPPVHAIGPWRDIFQVRASRIDLRHADLRATLHGSRGILDVKLDIANDTSARGYITCAGHREPLTATEDGALTAHIEFDEILPWWPHTHGEPTLYQVKAEFDDVSIDLGRVGFRHISVDRDIDGKGFGLIVNGVPVFCRGACWTNADIVGLSASRETYLPALLLMRDAGMNMLRLGGTMVYEGDAFYRLCDDLGLMIWQDFMFANFDYPTDDDAFMESAKAEAHQFLSRTQASPSLVVFCGGSEVAQQAAMFGLPEKTWSNRLFDQVLPDAVVALRPDVPYVPHTPFGGELPFVAHEGISHYYGVSAYMRPLDDARRADVRFATECLCFANVPDRAPFTLEPDAPLIEHPPFGARIAGDTGATWYFEGVRNFYTELLYGVCTGVLRQEDPERFLDVARATSAEVMEATFAEWRRSGSRTRGGLVWNFQDLWPGAGWGIVDSLGEPKAAYYGLKRAFKAVTVLLTDEGNNGLWVHLVNETALAKPVHLNLRCLRDGATPVMRATRKFVLQPRSTMAVSATELWGGFFDTTYAYRFGEPSHDVTVAQLYDAEDTLIAEAFHFPLGRGCARYDLGLETELVRSGDAWMLNLSTQRLAQSVHIKDAFYRAEDNWFHLAPGHTRCIRLTPRETTTERPNPTVTAINAHMTPDGLQIDLPDACFSACN